MVNPAVVNPAVVNPAVVPAAAALPAALVAAVIRVVPEVVDFRQAPEWAARAWAVPECPVPARSFAFPIATPEGLAAAIGRSVT